MRIRKPNPEYSRAQAIIRRERARAVGKCDALCGKDVGPEVNPRTNVPYRSCEGCRERQKLAARMLRVSKKTLLLLEDGTPHLEYETL